MEGRTLEPAGLPDPLVEAGKELKAQQRQAYTGWVTPSSARVRKPVITGCGAPGRERA